MSRSHGSPKKTRPRISAGELFSGKKPDAEEVAAVIAEVKALDVPLPPEPRGRKKGVSFLDVDRSTGASILFRLSESAPSTYDSRLAEKNRRFVEGIKVYLSVLARNPAKFLLLLQTFNELLQDEEKAKQLARLEGTLLDPKLDQVWRDFINENMARVKPFRVKDQPDEERDKIHPLHIFVGAYIRFQVQSYFYFLEEMHHTTVHTIIADKSAAKGNVDDALDGYNQAYEKFKLALRSFTAKTPEGQALYDLLFAEYQKLRLLKDDWIKNGEEAKAIYEKISELTEQVRSLTWNYVEAGMKVNDFSCFIVAQKLDSFELYRMVHEGQAFREISEALDEVAEGRGNGCHFTPRFAELMQRVEARFSVFRDLFIWPSYLHGAELYYDLAQRYKMLLSRLQEALVGPELSSKVIVGASNPSSDFAEFTSHEEAVMQMLTACKSMVRNLLQKSVTYAEAAIQLEKAEGFEAVLCTIDPKILSNLRKWIFCDGSLVASSTNQEFKLSVVAGIQEEWGDVLHCMQSVTVTRLPEPAPTECCRDELEAILRRHGIDAAGSTSSNGRNVTLLVTS